MQKGFFLNLNNNNNNIIIIIISILWGRWTGGHPQEDLAKFGCKSKRKVDFFWGTHLYIGNMIKPISTSLSLAISKKKLLVIFSKKNPLYKLSPLSLSLSLFAN